MADEGGPRRIPQVDVLRGIAALGVFLFHVATVLEFSKRTMPPVVLGGKTYDAIPSVFSLGATGVSLFFVISGFCLALQPLRRGASTIVAAPYYRERIARIYPSYAVAVLASAAIATVVGTGWSMAELATCLFFLQGAIQRWVFSLNGALWSMSTEVQFYLCFPLAYAALSRFGPVRFLAATLIVVMVARGVFWSLPDADLVIGGITRSTFLMNTLVGRFAEFGLGMVTAQALLANRDRLARVARALVVPGVFAGAWAKGFGPTAWADPVLGIAFAAVLACAVTGKASDESSLAARFGRSLYPFFLLHYPVLAGLLFAFPGLRALPPYTAFGMLALLGFLATLPLSLMLHHWLEFPAWQALRPRRAPALP